MNSRDKGKRGERMAAKKFREHGFDTRRGVQYQGGPDSPDVVGPEGLHIEASSLNASGCGMHSPSQSMMQGRANCR